MLPEGDRLRFGRLADDTDLLVERAIEPSYDDRNDGILDTLGEHLFDIPRQLRRRLVGRLKILDQRDGDSSIRPHWHPLRKVRVAPDEDAQIVSWSNDVLRRLFHQARWRDGRLLKPRASPNQQHGKRNQRPRCSEPFKPIAAHD